MGEPIRSAFFGHDDSRTIAVRRWMIEATRDPDGDANLPAALMLAQITFWTQPDERTGKVRAGHDHGGHAWLVRADEEWEDELGMSARTARRVRKRLADLGWIEAKTLVDTGVRCTHIRRLTVTDEPSTIRPEPAIDVPAAPESIAGPGQVSELVQAESHAGAILPIDRDLGERTPCAEAPPQQNAGTIVAGFLDWCDANHRARPGNIGMVAKNVKALLDAGHAPAVVKHALITAPTATIPALEMAINTHRPPTSGPRAPITSDRDRPSGKVTDL